MTRTCCEVTYDWVKEITWRILSSGTGSASLKELIRPQINSTFPHRHLIIPNTTNAARCCITRFDFLTTQHILAPCLYVACSTHRSVCGGVLWVRHGGGRRSCRRDIWTAFHRSGAWCGAAGCPFVWRTRHTGCTGMAALLSTIFFLQQQRHQDQSLHKAYAIRKASLTN